MTMHADRRRFLRTLTAGMTALAAPGVFAQALRETATTTEGPFYPDRMPLDTDNDLLILNDAITPGVGQVTHLTGRVLTPSGQPMRNAFVEIWQADSTASDVHTGGRQKTGHDRHFQGYGRFLTDARGQYYFRTIKPVDYTLAGGFRCAHIHVAVSSGGRRLFTTQLLVKDNPGNARDMLPTRMDPAALATLLVPFTPMPGSKIKELNANFEIVLGRTAVEGEDGILRGVPASEVQRRRRS
jgi:protocatechuate 3,4-dioxygenase beta subunit